MAGITELISPVQPRKRASRFSKGTNSTQTLSFNSISSIGVPENLARLHENLKHAEAKILKLTKVIHTMSNPAGLERATKRADHAEEVNEKLGAVYDDISAELAATKAELSATKAELAAANAKIASLTGATSAYDTKLAQLEAQRKSDIAYFTAELEKQRKVAHDIYLELQSKTNDNARYLRAEQVQAQAIAEQEQSVARNTFTQLDLSDMTLSKPQPSPVAPMSPPKHMTRLQEKPKSNELRCRQSSVVSVGETTEVSGLLTVDLESLRKKVEVDRRTRARVSKSNATASTPKPRDASDASVIITRPSPTEQLSTFLLPEITIDSASSTPSKSATAVAAANVFADMSAAELSAPVAELSANALFTDSEAADDVCTALPAFDKPAARPTRKTTPFPFMALEQKTSPAWAVAPGSAAEEKTTTAADAIAQFPGFNVYQKASPTPAAVARPSFSTHQKKTSPGAAAVAQTQTRFSSYQKKPSPVAPVEPQSTLPTEQKKTSPSSSEVSQPSFSYNVYQKKVSPTVPVAPQSTLFVEQKTSRSSSEVSQPSSSYNVYQKPSPVAATQPVYPAAQRLSQVPFGVVFPFENAMSNQHNQYNPNAVREMSIDEAMIAEANLASSRETSYGASMIAEVNAASSRDISPEDVAAEAAAAEAAAAAAEASLDATVSSIASMDDDTFENITNTQCSLEVLHRLQCQLETELATGKEEYTSINNQRYGSKLDRHERRRISDEARRLKGLCRDRDLKLRALSSAIQRMTPTAQQQQEQEELDQQQQLRQQQEQQQQDSQQVEEESSA